MLCGSTTGMCPLLLTWLITCAISVVFCVLVRGKVRVHPCYKSLLFLGNVFPSREIAGCDCFMFHLISLALV